MLYERVAHKVAGHAFNNVLGAVRGGTADSLTAFRVLDVASGYSREPGATIARAIPRAEVLATDQTEFSIGDELLPPNLSVGVENAEELDGVKNASVDAVTCSFGLEHLQEPVAALRSFHRVLRPGGMMTLVTWGPKEDVAWFAPLSAAAEELGTNLFDPSVPASTSALSDEYLASTLQRAGFVAIEIEADDLLAFFETTSDWYEAVVLGGPWEDFCNHWQMPDSEIRWRFEEAAKAYEGPNGGIMCRSAVRIITAVKGTGKVVRKPPGAG